MFCVVRGSPRPRRFSTRVGRSLAGFCVFASRGPSPSTCERRLFLFVLPSTTTSLLSSAVHTPHHQSPLQVAIHPGIRVFLVTPLLVFSSGFSFSLHLVFF